MRQLLLGFLAFSFSTAVARADEPKASTAMLGKKIADVSFTDEKGVKHSLHDKAEATVVVFLSFECPVATSYAQPLSDLAKDLAVKKVRFVGLICNPDETPAGVAKQARHFNITFPVYLDKDCRGADALKAGVTPEAFVLDKDFVLRYRGRIDDAYYERLKKHGTVKNRDLEDALKSMLSGKTIREPATAAVGCPIQRDLKLAREGKVTFHRDVEPILQSHCQQCHRPGEVGPFSLMTYKQAVSWSDLVQDYTKKRLMPPWKPTESVTFHNDRRMSQKEIDTIAAWVDSGMPEGDPKDAPPAKKFTEGWLLGTPDLVLTAEADFTLGPTGRDLFRCMVLPTNLSEDKYVVAVETRPSNPRVVHHVLLFVDNTGQGRKLEAKAQKDRLKDPDAVDVGPGYTVSMGVGFTPQGGLGGWAPGQIGRYLPEGTGYPLRKGSDVIVQTHFHRNGRLEKDRTQIGLYFAKAPVKNPLQGGVVAGGSGTGLARLLFSIPAGAEKFKLHGESWARDDFKLLTISPHMHMLGKEIKLTMTPPDGKKETLIYINDWDYNWQETFTLKEPLAVKKGTRFEVEAIYDNSAKNPHNPFNPPQRVTFGEQTTNEMCFVFLSGTSERGVTGSLRRGLPLSPTKAETKAAAP
ncbi:MAG: redoxin domain-containing protein [Gemmataceae bacterium]